MCVFVFLKKSFIWRSLEAEIRYRCFSDCGMCFCLVFVVTGPSDPGCSSNKGKYQQTVMSQAVISDCIWGGSMTTKKPKSKYYHTNTHILWVNSSAETSNVQINRTFMWIPVWPLKVLHKNKIEFHGKAASKQHRRLETDDTISRLDFHFKGVCSLYAKCLLCKCIL